MRPGQEKFDAVSNEMRNRSIQVGFAAKDDILNGLGLVRVRIGPSEVTENSLEKFSIRHDAEAQFEGPHKFDDAADWVVAQAHRLYPECMSADVKELRLGDDETRRLIDQVGDVFGAELAVRAPGRVRTGIFGSRPYTVAGVAAYRDVLKAELRWLLRPETTLSEAIRRGAMLGPNVYATARRLLASRPILTRLQVMPDIAKKLEARRAPGALDPDINAPDRAAGPLGERFPFLNDMSRGCPACGTSTGASMRIAATIHHLNEWHEWTADQIADWVQTVEPPGRR